MIAGAPAAVSQLNQSLAPEIRRLLATLHAAVPGAYVVGGLLRDLLAGRVPLDLDIVTPGDAQDAAKRLAAVLGAPAFALDEERGHYRVTLRHGAPVREIDVSQAADIEADLLRRDYTVDALAAAVTADGALGELIDPTGGARDLADGVLRMISRKGLAEDPLRLLRGARLALELGLDIDEETEAGIRELAPLLERAAPERQREELVRILGSARSAVGVRLLDSLLLLKELLPEVVEGRGVEQPWEHHYWDVFDHSVETLAALDEMFLPDPSAERWLARSFRDGLQGFDFDAYLDEAAGGHSRRVLLKLAALLHDNAKPETKAEQPDGRIRFLGHPEQGADKATAICHRLRFGNRETHFVSLLVEEHLRPTQLSQGGELPTRRALYRFFRDLGDAAPACLFLSLADAAAARGPRLQPERWAGHVAYVAWVLEQGLQPEEQAARRERLIDGSALMEALGIGPGPELGRLLAAIDEAQAVGELTTREEAIEYARGMAGRTSDE
jgi:poly(A) polymerase